MCVPFAMCLNVCSLRWSCELLCAVLDCYVSATRCLCAMFARSISDVGFFVLCLIVCAMRCLCAVSVHYASDISDMRCPCVVFDCYVSNVRRLLCCVCFFVSPICTVFVFCFNYTFLCFV